MPAVTPKRVFWTTDWVLSSNVMAMNEADCDCMSKRNPSAAGLSAATDFVDDAERDCTV